MAFYDLPLFGKFTKFLLARNELRNRGSSITDHGASLRGVAHRSDAEQAWLQANLANAVPSSRSHVSLTRVTRGSPSEGNETRACLALLSFFPCAPSACCLICDGPHIEFHEAAWQLTTGYSKLEQLEQELKSIRQVVQPAASRNSSVWTPPSPRAAIPALPDQRSGSTGGIASSTPQAPTPKPESSASHRSAQGSERRVKTRPAEARILGNHVVSGEDIEWYFTK